MSTLASTAGATAAMLSGPPGIRSLPGLPDPDGYTNLATWHLPHDSKVSVTWWKANLPDPKSYDQGEQQQLKRFEGILQQLAILRHTEACMLELAARLKSSLEQGNEAESRSNDGRNDGEEGESQAAPKDEKVDAEEQAFIKIFLSERLLFAVQEDTVLDEVSPESVGNPGKSKSASTKAGNNSKRRKLNEQTVPQPKSGHSLWLFKFAFSDPSHKEAEARSLTLCEDATKTAQSLSLNSARAKDMATEEELQQAEDLLRACALAQLELPHVKIDPRSPTGTVTLGSIRSKPSVTKGITSALQGAFTSWATYRHRGRLRQDAAARHQCYRLVPLKEVLAMVPLQMEFTEGGQDNLSLHRSRPQQLKVVKLNAFLSSVVCQVHLDDSVQIENIRGSVQGSSSVHLGDPLILAPSRTRATLVKLWTPASLEFLKSKRTDLESWLRVKKDLRENLLIEGCLASEEVHRDLRDDRFVLCRLNSEGPEERLILWPQSLCMLYRPGRHEATRAPAKSRPHVGLFRTSEHLLDGLEQVKATIQHLTKPAAQTSENLVPETVGATLPSKTEMHAPEKIAGASTLQPDRLMQPESQQQQRQESPYDQEPEKESRPQEGSPKAQGTASSEDEHNANDADLWGEDGEDEELNALLSAAGGESRASASQADASALLTQLYEGPFSTMHEEGDTFAAPSNQGDRAGGNALEGMDLVTDDDFDFFGGGNAGDLGFGDAIDGAQGTPSHDRMARHVQLSPEPQIDHPKEHVGNDEQPAFSAATGGSLTSNFSSMIDPPSLIECTPSSFTDTSSALGAFAKTPRTPADEQTLIHEMHVAPFSADSSESQPAPHASEVVMKDAEVDLTFDALADLNSRVMRTESIDIGSKYEQGKFAMPLDDVSAEHANGESTQNESKPPIRPGLKKRASLLELLRARHDQDEETSEAGSIDRSASADSEPGETDTDSNYEIWSSQEETTTMISQQEYLEAAISMHKVHPWTVPQLDNVLESPAPLAENDGNSSESEGLTEGDGGYLLRQRLTARRERLAQAVKDRSSSSALISSARSLSAAFACQTVLRTSSPQSMEQASLLVSSRGSVVRIGASAISFWDKMNLGPVGGRKDVVAFVFTETSAAGRQAEILHLLRGWKVRYEVRLVRESRVISLRLQVRSFSDHGVGLVPPS